VSETNELADEGFHEIQLNGKQLVFLFIFTASVLVATFLMGVKVGRGVPLDRGIEGGDAFASATPPEAATPSQPAAAGGPPAAEPPAPAPEPDDELSYAKRLQGDQSAAPAEKLKSASPAPPVPAPKPVEPPPATVAAPGTTSRPAPPPAAQPSPAAAAGRAADTGRPGAFIVQLTALKIRSEAVTIVRGLVAKGYPAFVQDPAPGSPPLYRVQVGGFPDREAASQAARRLEKEEQFKPYVRSR
jgi:cell division septation protein DedD